MWLFDIFTKKHFRCFIDLIREAKHEIMSLRDDRPDDHGTKYMTSMRSVMSSKHTAYVLDNVVVDPEGKPDKGYIFRELELFLAPCLAAAPTEVRDEMLTYIETNENFRRLKQVNPGFIERRVNSLMSDFN